MNNPFLYTDSNKRYHTFDYHLKQKFGTKVFKVSLNAGFGCPNRDGTKGYGGCTFCSGTGSGDFAGNPDVSLKEQFDTVSASMHNKWANALCMPYFQAYTNTYAPLDVLKACYEQVLLFDDVVGLSIATRPDCIDEAIADYLQELSKRTYLIVELGLQTVHDKTAEKFNRGYPYEEFLYGFSLLKERGLNICVHIINGLPGESKEMMMQTVRQVVDLKPTYLKVHLLHILKNTVIAKQYCAGEFGLMTQEDYVNLVCDQLEIIPPEVVIQRLTGDGEKQSLIGPLWSLKKFCVLNDIDKELVRRNSWQGKYAKIDL
ncbi:MAG: TIGR01212 family radical SAM protein [Oscillospiraceae bacterium]